METEKDKIFTALYRDFFPAVNGSIYTKVGNRDTAADLAQEVFTDLFERMENIQNIRAWLFEAVKNRIIDYYKKQSNRPEFAIEGLNLTFVNGFRDTRIIIQEAIAGITDGASMVLFDLIAVRFYTYREAAKETGLLVHQVRYRYNQIIKTILENLKNKGINSLEDLL